MKDLPELPSDLQDDFESALAKAELEYSRRSERFPYHPQLADGALQLPILIHAVFFEFCFFAQQARRRGDWSRSQTRRAIDAAFQVICDFYLTRERGNMNAEMMAAYRIATWRTAADDPRWKEILSEMATLGETRRNSPAKTNAPLHAELSLPDPANSSDLPELDQEATARIATALEAAHSYIAGPFVTDAHRICKIDKHRRLPVHGEGPTLFFREEPQRNF